MIRVRFEVLSDDSGDFGELQLGYGVTGLINKLVPLERALGPSQLKLCIQCGRIYYLI